MRKTITSSLLTLLLFHGLSARPETITQKRLQVVKSLQAKKYFKYAPCPDVAGAILHKVGLPALAKGQALPVFQNKMTTPAPQHVTVKVQGRILKSTPPERWALQISRSMIAKLKSGPLPVAMDTEFSFTVEPNQGRKTCELTGITFKLKNKPSDKNLRPEEVTIQECLDLFLTTDTKVSQELMWIKTDCAQALHYSKDAKKLAAGSK